MRARNDIHPLSAAAVVLSLAGAAVWSTQASAATPSVVVEEDGAYNVSVTVEGDRAPTFQIYQARTQPNAKPRFVIELPGADIANAPVTAPSAVLFHAASAYASQARSAPRVEVTFFSGVDYTAKTKGNALVVTFTPVEEKATLLAGFNSRKSARARAVALAKEVERKKTEAANAKRANADDERKRLAALEAKRKAEAAVEAERLLQAERTREEKARVAALEKKRLEVEAARKVAALEAERKKKAEEAERKRIAAETERKRLAAVAAEKERQRLAKVEAERLAAIAAEKERQRLAAIEAENKRKAEEAKRIAALKLEEERLRKADEARKRALALEAERKRVEAEKKRAAEIAAAKEKERLRLATIAAEKQRQAQAEQRRRLEAQRREQLALEKAKREQAERLAAQRERDRLEKERVAKAKREAERAAEQAALRAQQERAEKARRQAEEAKRLQAVALQQKREALERQQRAAQDRARAEAVRKQEERKRLAAERRRQASEIEGRNRGQPGDRRRIEVASANRSGFGFGGTKSVDIGGRGANSLYTLAKAPRIREDAFGGGDDDDDGPVGVLSRVTVRREARGKSAVGIRVDGGARYAVSRRSTNELVLTLFDTRAQSLTVRRILDARDLRTSILRVLPHVEEDARNRVELVIELRGTAAARVTEENDMLWLHVES